MTADPPIAPLRTTEADAAIALWRAAGLTRPWNDPAADIAAALAGPASTILAARADGLIVGTVMAGYDGHRGWLYYLAVAPGRRGQGIGRRLIAAAETWLAERGAPKAQLMIRHDNHAAAGFYAKLGYERQEAVVVGRRLDGG